MLRNEKGIALLSVLGVLAVLLVLGAMVAGSSRTETALSGIGRFSARAFNAADAGLGLALGDANNFVQLATRCTDLYDAGLGTNADVCVRFDHEGPPPIDIKVSVTKFTAFHFDMDSTGTAETNASASLEMEAARLGPKS